MDKASIIAIEEVCKRCPLYTKDCGMLKYPSQCVDSGHFIDGYRKAEEDLALTKDDVWCIFNLVRELQTKYPATEGCLQEVAVIFNEQRQK